MSLSQAGYLKEPFRLLYSVEVELEYITRESSPANS